MLEAPDARSRFMANSGDVCRKSSQAHDAGRHSLLASAQVVNGSRYASTTMSRDSRGVSTSHRSWVRKYARVKSSNLERSCKSPIPAVGRNEPGFWSASESVDVISKTLAKARRGQAADRSARCSDGLRNGRVTGPSSSAVSAGSSRPTRLAYTISKNCGKAVHDAGDRFHNSATCRKNASSYLITARSWTDWIGSTSSGSHGRGHKVYAGLALSRNRSGMSQTMARSFVALNFVGKTLHAD